MGISALLEILQVGLQSAYKMYVGHPPNSSTEQQTHTPNLGDLRTLKIKFCSIFQLQKYYLTGRQHQGALLMVRGGGIRLGMVTMTMCAVLPLTE